MSCNPSVDTVAFDGVPDLLAIVWRNLNRSALSFLAKQSFLSHRIFAGTAGFL